MTTKTLIFCETCPRSEEASGSEDRGWAKLDQKGKTRDVCPTCVAKVEGWKDHADRFLQLGRRSA